MRPVERFVGDRGGVISPKLGLYGILAVTIAAGLAHFVVTDASSDRQALAALIRFGQLPGRAASRPDLDMTTTGSLAKRANQTRLDPCNVDAKP
jgi:hypothetical protein